MPDHIVIRREAFVSGTRQRPEVKVFTQTHQTRHPVPWGKLGIGDNVWMKWSGGPIVAKSVVNGFRQIENCTADVLRQATAGSLLAEFAGYFDSLPPRLDAVIVYLDQEEWLDEPFVPTSRSRSESWIVLHTDALREQWLRPGAEASAMRAGSSTKSARGSRTLSPALRFQVFRRDGFACVYCGRHAPQVKLHVDHVVPWSKGGRNAAENLRTACEECNLGKGAGASR